MHADCTFGICVKQKPRDIDILLVCMSSCAFEVSRLRNINNICKALRKNSELLVNCYEICNGNCAEINLIDHFPAGKSTSIQRRGRRQNDVDFRSKTQIESTLIYRRRNDVDETTSKRRRQNDVETTSTE